MSLHILANDLASKGRNNDSLLVHMTPNEVNSLQGLAIANGGSLTVNPDTGLPEAGFLDSILPMVAGFALGPAGLGVMSSLGAAATVGGITGLLEGDLGKGLMAGLGAYSGSSLGQSLLGTDALGVQGGKEAAKKVAQEATKQQAAQQAATAKTLAGTDLNIAPKLNATTGNYVPGAYQPTPTPAVLPQVGTQTGNIPAPVIDKGTQLAKERFSVNPWMVGAGALGLGALAGQQGGVAAPNPYNSNYNGPYKPAERDTQFQPYEQLISDSSEYKYFTPEVHPPGVLKLASGGSLLAKAIGDMDEPKPKISMGANTQNVQSQMPVDKPIGTDHTMLLRNPQRMAEGGLASIDDGAFVVDARTVSELGNGSSAAGIELLAQLGGVPINGPGDGVSDSIPAMVDGQEEIRVAREEVVFSPEALANLGGGDETVGAQKLYTLMDRAKEAREQADRGEDNGMAKQMGLGGLVNEGVINTI